MTYREIFEMKYSHGVSTSELVKRFPADVKRISEVALLDIPDEILRQVISESQIAERLIDLKRRFGVCESYQE